MSLVHLIPGIAMVVLGCPMVFGRERIVERQRSRLPASAVQSPPMLWAVMGGMFLVTGLLQVVAAFA